MPLAVITLKYGWPRLFASTGALVPLADIRACADRARVALWRRGALPRRKPLWLCRQAVAVLAAAGPLFWADFERDIHG